MTAPEALRNFRVWLFQQQGRVPMHEILIELLRRENNDEVPLAKFLIAQNDDRELLEWLSNAQLRGGAFITAIATAGLCADCENYALFRPLLLAMRAKYPAYEPTEQVKREIRDKTCPRCGHQHEGLKECGVEMGPGRICPCELEVPA